MSCAVRDWLRLKVVRGRLGISGAADAGDVCGNQGKLCVKTAKRRVMGGELPNGTMQKGRSSLLCSMYPSLRPESHSCTVSVNAGFSCIVVVGTLNLIWYTLGARFSLCKAVGLSEPILVSLPPLVRWRYDWRPEAGVPEVHMYYEFPKPKELT